MYNITNTKQRVQNIKGVPYVYEDYPYWDAAKKQMRHKREYIGKLGADGEFVPNKAYTAQQEVGKLVKQRNAVQKQPPAIRTYFGATHLLDAIGESTGIVADLKACFPENYLKILSLAYYLVLESDNPMYRFSKWASNHRHPYGNELSSQRISEIFTSISEDIKMAFFKKQSKRRLEKEYLAYDTTSISSYSELIAHVKYGKNKDLEPLPQINLALVFGQDSMLPVYYRKLPGNIPDVKTICKLLKDVDFMDIKKVKLVMDRGFYSAKNINDLFRNHYKFVVATKCTTKFAGAILESVRESIKDFICYDAQQDIYYTGSMEKWSYEELDSNGNVILQDERRIYVHIYYNGQRAENEKSSFIKSLANVEQNLLEGNCSEEQKAFCDKYFIRKETPVKGIKIEYNEQAIRDHMKNFGYFILLSNDIKDSSAALSIYRNKDLIEKAFGNLKNRLGMSRTSVSSSENLEGKLFIQFIALIYVSYIHKYMKESKLYQNYSMQSLLDELDIIERFDYAGQRYHCSEITKKQQSLYECLGVKPPNML